MWLFVFIVATFFYLYITIGFACLTPKGRVAGERGMFGLGIKNTTDRRELWRFFIPKPKEYPLRHTLSYGKQVKSLVDWTMNRSHDSGTVKTGSRIISGENKFFNCYIKNGTERHDQHSLLQDDDAGNQPVAVYAECRKSRPASD